MSESSPDFNYSTASFVLDAYEQGKQVQIDLYHLRGVQPSYDLMDELSIALGQWDLSSPEGIANASERAVEALNELAKGRVLDAFDDGAENVVNIVPTDKPWATGLGLKGRMLSVNVKVSYDYLEALK